MDSKQVGALPIVNHFLRRLRITELMDGYLPPPDPRAKMAPRQALGVLLRNLIMNRSPLYSVGEWAQDMVPGLLGLQPEQVKWINDDRIGRALDRLFDADRAALLTDLVVHMVREFDVDLEQFHNDSTSITLHGEYAEADGHPIRGKATLVITFGHNKDHRRDLKQLLWILTISADGAVPVHFKVADGNTEDSTTHIETWEILRKLVGSSNFLYVGDSKLCVRENLNYIDERGGGFITRFPRTRKEDTEFREWIQTHTPEWEQIAQFPHPRRKQGPPDIVRAVKSPIPDSDGYRLIWYHSTAKQERDAKNRQKAISRALNGLKGLQAKLEGPRCRYTALHGVAEAADKILLESSAQRWLRYQIEEWDEKTYRQEKRGRPGKKTRWRRKVKKRFRLTWEAIGENLEKDRRTDGTFPLLTNCREMSMLDVLQVYKCKQPFVEKRHDLVKNVLEVTPAYLKSVSRLEAFLFLSYIATTVHALIERQLRTGMADREIENLPLYPEGRECSAPTMARVLDIFENLQRHVLSEHGEIVTTFAPKLKDIHRTILPLLGLTSRGYHASWGRHVV